MIEQKKEPIKLEWKLWLVYLFIICCVALIISTVLWLVLPGESPLGNALDELEAAIAELEVDMAAITQRSPLVWDTVLAAVFDRAWVMTWASPNQPPPDRVMDSHAYWHIGELDAVVDGQPFQVWRCKFIGEPCDPDADVLCIDLGGDGVSWEFRFNDEEIGTLQIR